MASLDQFLQDLDDLDDELAGGADEEVQNEEGREEDDIDMVGEDMPKLTSGLLASGRLDEVIEHIEDLVVQNRGPTDSEAEYSAIVSCNEMVIDADTEVQTIAKSIKDDYAKRFPELESLIPNPLDYARVVLKLGNETDLTQVDLTGILPSASIMVVTVTASTTAGTALPEAALQNVQDACEQVLKLSSHKQKMLAFVESRMATVAPNLSAIVGTQVAAKLIGAAGGLDKLAALPSTVLQVLGSRSAAAVHSAEWRVTPGWRSSTLASSSVATSSRTPRPSCALRLCVSWRASVRSHVAPTRTATLRTARSVRSSKRISSRRRSRCRSRRRPRRSRRCPSRRRPRASAAVGGGCER